MEVADPDVVVLFDLCDSPVEMEHSRWVPASIKRVFEEPRDALFLLQRWYVQQCDDEWEHSYGVKIDTLDNPGWTLAVDLVDTAHAGTPRDWTQVERSEHDWIHWRVHEDRFEAACGPTNLNEAILAFLDLVDARAPG